MEILHSDILGLIANLISAVLLPPLNLILLGIIGFIYLKRHPLFGKSMIILMLTLFYLLSTPLLANRLLSLLEPAPLSLSEKKGQAIVVLGAGRYVSPPEYGNDTVNALALVRVRYAAKLYQTIKKPILVSGGKPGGGTLSEATAMKQVLESEFITPVSWTEEASTNTLENAVFSQKILKTQGITSVYVVTHAWHIPRATMAFKYAGLDLIPAATEFTNSKSIDLFDFIPSAAALRNSYFFMHEIVGILWYWIKINFMQLMQR